LRQGIKNDAKQSSFTKGGGKKMNVIHILSIVTGILVTNIIVAICLYGSVHRKISGLGSRLLSGNPNKYSNDGEGTAVLQTVICFLGVFGVIFCSIHNWDLSYLTFAGIGSLVYGLGWMLYGFARLGYKIFKNISQKVSRTISGIYWKISRKISEYRQAHTSRKIRSSESIKERCFKAINRTRECIDPIERVQFINTTMRLMGILDTILKRLDEINREDGILALDSFNDTIRSVDDIFPETDLTKMSESILESIRKKKEVVSTVRLKLMEAIERIVLVFETLPIIAAEAAIRGDKDWLFDVENRISESMIRLGITGEDLKPERAEHNMQIAIDPIIIPPPTTRTKRNVEQ